MEHTTQSRRTGHFSDQLHHETTIGRTQKNAVPFEDDT